MMFFPFSLLVICSHEEIDVSHPDFFATAKLNGYVPPNKEVNEYKNKNKKNRAVCQHRPLFSSLSQHSHTRPEPKAYPLNVLQHHTVTINVFF